MKTPKPWKPELQSPEVQARVQQAWSTVWRVIGLLVPILLALVGAQWMSLRSSVATVEAQGKADVDRVEGRVERIEDRTVRALERIDTRLDAIEKKIP